ncbi:MAG: ATP-binding protein [Acidobacteria bacterium]|nr:ATP-binding protein [Acidobacteriota bacterium]
MMDHQVLEASLILASRFENIEVAERALVDLCQRAGCANDEEYWLVTALREAVANAVRHGNDQDPNRVVRVAYSINNSTVTIRVEDEGEGFNPEEIPDPTDPENLLRPSGRGIFYMRQFMNRVEFSTTPAGGTAVVMVKDLANNDSDRS